MSDHVDEQVAPLLWTPAQAATALTISRRKLWAMTNAGEVPCIRLGRVTRYDPAALRQWLADGAILAQSGPQRRQAR